MGTVYRKTLKGSSEIETRAHRLPPRSRSLLILVDGRRSEAELCKLIGPQADQALQALLADGFIDAAGPVEPRPLPPAAAPQPPPTVPPPRPAVPPGAPRVLDFVTLRRDAVRHLTDQLGPMAEALAVKMERARDMHELAPLLASAAQVIANVRGAQAAATFRSRFST